MDFKGQYKKDLREIISGIALYYPNFTERRRKKISDAFWFAEKAHEGQFRESGDPYFIHPIAATKILLEIRPNIDTVCACLMHDVIEDTPVTADDIEKEFGSDIRFLCEGVEKVAQIRIAKHESDQKKFENIQKLFVAMAKDIRVIFIKLADRIHNLQTLDFVPPEKRERIAKESMEIYAPIANKLGLFTFKSAIEEHCFKALYPRDFKKISQDLSVSSKLRKRFIEKARKEILKKFQEERFPIESIEVRQKDIYSIFCKMKRKGLQALDDIYDFLGVRIIVKTNSDCYRALGILHENWRPIPKRFKDYIAIPKPNGYQSLHTTVLGLGQNTLPTEVQIRTKKMHSDAKYGPAAHWLYKTSKENFDEEYTQKTSWVPRRIIGKENKSAAEFFQEISGPIFSERIYAFTPNGELKFFSKGATPVDFAYSVHTHIGDTCSGARVNGVIKPLDYQMKNGDVIDILTKKGRIPNPLWLNFVRSNTARDKIKNALRKHGEEFVDKEKTHRLAKKTLVDQKLEKLEKKQDYPQVSRKNSSKQIIIGGEADMPYRLAACCKPKKTDPIIAYKNLGKDFSIHKVNCPELENLDSERFYEAHYLHRKKLSINVSDGFGVLNKISSIITQQHIDIYSVRTKSDFHSKTAVLDFVLYVHSETEYKELLKDLEKTRYFIEFRKV